MNKMFFFIVLLTSMVARSQEVLPVLDFNNRMKSFEDGFFRQVEMQPIDSFIAGDNVIGYIDFRENLRVYDGNEPVTLVNIKAPFQVSDNLLVWQIGTNLNLWDAGVQTTLCNRVGNYVVRDSLVVFEDLRYNSVQVYYAGQIYDLYSNPVGVTLPESIGENVLAFKDNGNFYKVFWRGGIYDLDVWHRPYVFSAGTDMVAFNDPKNGTFAIFENGQFLDVENFQMKSYKSGNGFVVYENLNSDLKLYQNGKLTTLSNFSASFWDVKDNVVYWAENGFTYAYSNGVKTEISRYIPADYKIKNGVVAFRNIMGGVSAMVDGKVFEISNQMDSKYSIHGNSVLVELFNRSYIVLQKGRLFTI